MSQCLRGELNAPLRLRLPEKIEYLSIVFRGSLIAQRRTMQMGSGVQFAVADSGAYQIDIAQTRGSDVNYRQSRGLVVGYPDELRLQPTNEELLQSLADVSGETCDFSADQVFEPGEETASNAVPLWPYLLSAALLLFQAEVALRRIGFSMILLKTGLKLPRATAPGRV